MPAPTPPAAEVAPPRIELPTIDPDALDEVSDVETQALRASEVSIVDAVEALPVARAQVDSDDRTEQVSASDLEPDVERTAAHRRRQRAGVRRAGDHQRPDHRRRRDLAPLRADPSRPPPRGSFDDERDASAALVEAGRRDEWAARATWLRAEAGFLEDRAARARGLAVASELMAMVGEERTAAEVAREARTLAPSRPSWRARFAAWPCATATGGPRWRRWSTRPRSRPPRPRVAMARCSRPPSSIATGRPTPPRKSLDFAARAVPADPRVYVRRMAEALAQSDIARAAPALAKLRMPDAAELERLAEAGAQLAGELSPQPHRVDRPAASPHDALVRARSALDAGDIGATLREPPPSAAPAGSRKALAGCAPPWPHLGAPPDRRQPRR